MDNFTTLFACDIIPERWYNLKLTGEWKGQSAGGCMSLANEKTWGLNPHFKFSVGVLTTAIVVLTQEDARMKRGDDFNNYKHAIGFVVYEAEDGKPKWSLKSEDVSASTPFMHEREVHLVFELRPRTTYFMVPSTFNAGDTGRYYVSIHSQVPISISAGERYEEGDHDPHAICQWAWLPSP